jgi:hypothetical protein
MFRLPVGRGQGGRSRTAWGQCMRCACPHIPCMPLCAQIGCVCSASLPTEPGFSRRQDLLTEAWSPLWRVLGSCGLLWVWAQLCDSTPSLWREFSPHLRLKQAWCSSPLPSLLFIYAPALESEQPPERSKGPRVKGCCCL